MKKYISSFLVGMFLAILIFACITDNILVSRRMKRVVNNFITCFVQTVPLDYALDYALDDSGDYWNGDQYLYDIYGEVLEVIDEDEVIIQSFEDGEPIITVKGTQYKSVIKRARTGDQVKVTYLETNGENYPPEKIYLGLYGEIVLLK